MKVIHPILIIGAGPAGIATAVEAMKRGFSADDILILEKSGEIAHMISAKYPDEKPVLANYKERMSECLGDLCIRDMSKPEFMSYMAQVVKERGLDVHFHEEVRKIVKLRNKQFSVETNKDSYICDSVFVAIGNMSAPRTLGVRSDEQVDQRIFYDIQKVEKDYKKVLVVGGGDSAAEYAKILVDRGHEVTLSYRGEAGFARMLPANKEITLSLIEKKQLRFLAQSNIERVEAFEGKPLVVFKEAQHDKQSFDALVTALGTEKPTRYLEAIGIQATHEGSELFSEAQLEGLFLVGDLASGRQGGSINFAFNSGVRAVAKACSLYLDCD